MKSLVSLVLPSLLLLAPVARARAGEPSFESRLTGLLRAMTLEEKIGQMTLGGRGSTRSRDPIPKELEEAVRGGRVGALINIMTPADLDRLQRIAVEESRLGVPLLFGRDVIHGFRTVFPIPLGQAATWNPELVQAGARIAAAEASSVGIRWTFAPMLDIARDPRWGRIAESFGEDPYLASIFAAAMVRGFQGDDLTDPSSLAACAKHFAGYGAAEGGRDYNTTYIPESLLRNVYLRPFEAAVRAGAATLMTGFNDLNGVPASANELLLSQVLRKEWQFDGFVVSDWTSITEMIAHGFSASEEQAARQAVLAGVDMDMMSPAYEGYLAGLVGRGEVPEAAVDAAAARILRVKLRLGLFDHPYRDPAPDSVLVTEEALRAAKATALQGAVLLKNADDLLPLSQDVVRIAVIGPLADARHEQLGTWTFDGQEGDTRTPLAALRGLLQDSSRVIYAPGLESSRTLGREGFDEALAAARSADVVLFFGGEEAILSGEAHSRADLDLPGAQQALIRELRTIGKPLVLVILAGRPITLHRILEDVDAVLVSWHPGTMGGPAIADLLFGKEAPSGRLPVTWPETVGQIPVYYNHKNTGRPPKQRELIALEDIPVGAWQSSLSNTSHYLDLGSEPQFPFGYGLTYTTFRYDDLRVDPAVLTSGGALEVTVTVTNTGTQNATEVAQLYVRDLVGSLTRPVRELKGFRRVELEPGSRARVRFVLMDTDLAFYNRQMELVTEPGQFRIWVGPNAAEGLEGSFEVR